MSRLRISLLLVASLATSMPARSQPLVSAVDVFKKVGPSVAKLTLLDAKGAESASASAFVVAENGLLATSYHSLVDKEEAWVAYGARVELPGREASPVEGVVAFDAEKDWAILKIAASGLPAIRLGDAKLLEKGQPVIAVGYPAGLDARPTVGTFGGWYEGQLLHDASTSSGNSGGPVLDQEGRAVGVSRGELRSTTTRVALNDLFFAVDIGDIREALSKGLSPVKKLPLVAPASLSAGTSRSRGTVEGGGGGGGFPTGRVVGIAAGTAGAVVGTVVAVKAADLDTQVANFTGTAAACAYQTHEFQLDEGGDVFVNLQASSLSSDTGIYLLVGRCGGTAVFSRSSPSAQPGCGFSSQLQQLGSCAPLQSGLTIVNSTLVPGIYTIVVHNKGNSSMTYKVVVDKY